mgnify:CR=1 FL=1
MDVFTGICQMLYLKFGVRSKRLGHAYDREWKKHFGDSDFKAVVHYNGYENYMISLIGHAPFRKTIWVHNDMEEELKEKKNPSRYALQDAYSSMIRCTGQQGYQSGLCAGSVAEKTTLR